MPPRYSREIEQPIVMGDSLKDQFRTSPCEASCPAGNPIQKMQSLVGALVKRCAICAPETRSPA